MDGTSYQNVSPKLQVTVSTVYKRLCLPNSHFKAYDSFIVLKYQWAHRKYSWTTQIFLPNSMPVCVPVFWCLTIWFVWWWVYLNSSTRISFSFRVRAVKPAVVAIERAGEDEQHEHEQSLSTTVLLSKPILALEFSCMEMQVQAPTVVSQYFKHSLRTTPWTNNTFHPILFTVQIFWKLFGRTLFSQSFNRFSFCLNWAFTIRWLLRCRIYKIHERWQKELCSPLFFNMIFSFLLVTFTKTFHSTALLMTMKDKHGKEIFTLRLLGFSNQTPFSQSQTRPDLSIRKLQEVADFVKMT